MTTHEAQAVATKLGLSTWVAQVVAAGDSSESLTVKLDTENVRRTTALLKASQPVLAGPVAQGKVGVVGVEYQLHSGAIRVIA